MYPLTKGGAKKDKKKSKKSVDERGCIWYYKRAPSESEVRRKEKPKKLQKKVKKVLDLRLIKMVL